jgi:hypothetical protein
MLFRGKDGGGVWDGVRRFFRVRPSGGKGLGWIAFISG